MITRREYVDLFVDTLDFLDLMHQDDGPRHPDDIHYDLTRRLDTFHATLMAIEATNQAKEVQ